MTDALDPRFLQPQLSDDEPDLSEFDPPPERVMVSNEFGLVKGENLANHTASIAGKGRYVMVAQRGMIMWRTKQSAFRFMAHLLELSDSLPDEPGAHSFDDVCQAVEKSLEQ